MKPIAIYYYIVNMKSIELVTCISGGIMQDLRTLIVHFSDYAVGVFAYQKMTYLFTLILCMCTAIKFTKIILLSFTNRCTVDQWLMLVGNQYSYSLLEPDNYYIVVLSSI